MGTAIAHVDTCCAQLSCYQCGHWLSCSCVSYSYSWVHVGELPGASVKSPATMSPLPDHPALESVTHVPYQREPYVRATVDDGSVVDGKATAWMGTHVLVDWYDRDRPAEVVAGIPIHMHSEWLLADRVQRIKRSESAWQDKYNDYDWYASQGEL